MPRTKKTTTEEKTVKKESKVSVAKPATKNAVAVKSEVPKKSTKVKLSIDVFDLNGNSAGTITLPEEIFGEKLNKQLLAQAVRVYMANKRQGNASTKTRGEVDGSTRKIYRQKGTGRARHGSIRAPIFVHGGVVHGPKPRDYSLGLPKKMKRKALFSALSAKLADGDVKILSGLETIEPKTKLFVSVIKKLGYDEKKRKLLLVTTGEAGNIKRAVRNVEGVEFIKAEQLNAYDALRNKNLLFMKTAISEMEKYFLRKETKNA